MVPAQRVIENYKKIPKIKKYHYGFISSENGWKRLRKRKNKIIIPFRFYQTRNRKFQKNRKKFIKLKKYHYGFISCQNWLEKTEKERK